MPEDETGVSDGAADWTLAYRMCAGNGGGFVPSHRAIAESWPARAEKTPKRGLMYGIIVIEFPV